ncbi:AIM24 family protein [Paenibacillus sp. H1-7]|uniref:AIM24 family protein n=1 Tax=Paenibacillus sp. H1-7 TaxID=2282849 RepID=UPI001EF7EDCE|nr:AIM24 family protein [Paenibacillus sp. H1-7]
MAQAKKPRQRLDPRLMNISAPPPLEHVRVSMEEAESLYILHPKSIIAYQGMPQNRQDQLMNLTGVYGKKKWIRSLLRGPCQMILGIPAGCSLNTVDLGEQEELLFDLRHVMMFSESLSMKSVIQKMKTAWITRDLVRVRFTGLGVVGLLTAGDLATLHLDPVKPIFVDKSALVAYPQNAKIRLSVYGNQLASQHMNVQWEITGTGPILIQTGSRDHELMAHLQDDSLFKRILRELLPFGNVIIK